MGSKVRIFPAAPTLSEVPVQTGKHIASTVAPFCGADILLGMRGCLPFFDLGMASSVPTVVEREIDLVAHEAEVWDGEEGMPDAIFELLRDQDSTH